MFNEQKQLFHWRRAKTNKHEVAYCTRLLVGGMLLVSAVGGSVQAGPSGEVVTRGEAEISRETNTTDIDQFTQRVDINWQNFDTTSLESVNFNQANASYVAINRISGSRTQFNGTLNAIGKIFLINQNGITFGNGAAVNVGSLLATTSVLDDDEPLFEEESVKAAGLSNGGYNFINEGGSINRSIDVDSGARITITSPGGFAVLVAPKVNNNGIIQNGADAPWVQIELASAGDFMLNADLRGDGLITYSVTPENFDGGEGNETTGVTNNGTLQARSGSIFVTANMATEIVNGVVNLNGIVDADQFVATPNGTFAAVANDSGENYQGGHIHVASVGDINIGGGTDIHAIGGNDVTADFVAADDINMGQDGSAANITLSAIGNGFDGGEGGNEVDADLTMRAGNDGSGSLNINGDITVKAENTGEVQGSYFRDPDADADVTLTAANDVTITTGEATILVSAMTFDEADLNTDADADLEIRAGVGESEGDLSVTGNIEVTADVGASGDADAEIDVDLSGNNVTINGDVTLAAAATSSNDDADGGDADLDITANNGDLSITGDITVTANSTQPTAGSDSADADADVDLRGRNVSIDGNVTVTADASVVDNGNDDYVDESEADANLDIVAYGEEGDLTVTGNILVDAEATRTGSYDQDADAYAKANLSAGRNISLSNITVEGTATNEGADTDEAESESYLFVNAGNGGAGDLEINGDITVRSTAAMGADGADTAQATAKAGLYAANNITIRGNTTVAATGTNVGAEDNGEAYAYLTIDAGGGEGYGGAGNLDITGDIDVLATASSISSTNEDDGDAHSKATALLTADDNITINGDTSVIAKSTVDTADPDGADALATLTVAAGTGFSSQETRVTAQEHQEDGQGSSGTPGDLTINGDIKVQADASTNASYATADAAAVLIASGDTNVRGDIDVDASARATSDNEAGNIYGTGYADADASLLMLGGVETGVDGAEGNLADAIAGLAEDIIREDEDGGIFGEIEGLGEGDINFTGDINVTATADLNVTGSGSGYGGSGYGSNGMAAGYSEATAAALILGGGDVTIDTDPVTVSSVANANYETRGTGEGSGYGSSFVDTESVSVLLVGAGLGEFDGAEGNSGGNLNIRGNMVSNAQQSATVNGVEDPEQNDELAAAVTGLFASGDLTIRGADPLANADNEAVVQQQTTAYQICESGECDPVTGGLAEYEGSIIPWYNDGSEAGFHQLAQLMIEAGGTVDIGPKELRRRPATPEIVGVLAALQSPEPVGPGWPGAQPMRIDNQGRLHAATGVGATKPPQVVAMDVDLEAALLSGADPSAILPPTAATGCVAAGNDAFSISAPDFFDQVVAGSCETKQ